MCDLMQVPCACAGHNTRRDSAGRQELLLFSPNVRTCTERAVSSADGLPILRARTSWREHEHEHEHEDALDPRRVRHSLGTPPFTASYPEGNTRGGKGKGITTIQRIHTGTGRADGPSLARSPAHGRTYQAVWQPRQRLMIPMVARRLSARLHHMIYPLSVLV